MSRSHAGTALARVVAAMTCAVLAACSTGSTGASQGSSPATTGSTGHVTVLAASSLTSTFTRLVEVFRAEHPGTTVSLNVAGSADLVAQLQQGAPGDVLATADTATMDRASADDLLAGAPAPFATNTMTIVVPPGNPAGVTTFADLARHDVTVVVCAPQVPCGAATAAVESNTGVSLSPVSEENAVADVLGKVSSGQADAGVVYVTDARAAGDAVSQVAIPAAVNATNTYPIAVLADSRDRALAGAFRDLVLSAQGQQVLADAGFAVPGGRAGEGDAGPGRPAAGE